MVTYTYNEPVGGSYTTDFVSNIRDLVEDTSPSAPFSLTDAQIEYEWMRSGELVNVAAANVAYKMGRRYAKEAVRSKSVGNVSISRDYGSSSAAYSRLAADLRSGANTGRVASGFFTGGDSLGQQFHLGQFDNR